MVTPCGSVNVASYQLSQGKERVLTAIGRDKGMEKRTDRTMRVLNDAVSRTVSHNMSCFTPLRTAFSASVPSSVAM